MLFDSLHRATPIVLIVLTVGAYVAAEKRIWTDATGKHRVEAEFVKMANGQVTLLRADGREATVQLQRLSQKDQDYIERLRRTRRTGDVAQAKKDVVENQEHGEVPDAKHDSTTEADAEDPAGERPFKVPSGNPRKLLAFIQQMQRMKPEPGGKPETNTAFHRDVQLAIVEAADRLLDRRARKPDVAMAVGAKLNALTLLSRMSRDQDVAQAVQAFPELCSTTTNWPPWRRIHKYERSSKTCAST